MFTHIVSYGETLWSIVMSYGLYPVSDAINKIIIENKLWRVPYIQPRQILKIPVDGLYYTVRQGDSLWIISRRFTVPINQLMSYNNIINPNIIYQGMVIKFPKKALEPKQYIICIDPGHQRYPNFETEPISPGSNIMKQKVSAGAEGVYTGKAEYELNLEVALKIKTILELKGYRVLMTRSTNDVNISNAQRAQMANEAKANLCVKIHADSSTNTDENGISVLYPAQNSPNINKNKYEKSKLLAEFLLKDLIKNTNANSKGIVPRSDLTGFNWIEIPAALIEMGFLSNPQEDRKMSTPEYQYRIAEGVVEGIEDYLSQ